MSVNKVILIGNLGMQPEVKPLNESKNVANLRMATSEKWKDKQTGETKERTEWHTVVFFGRIADIIGKYLTKGSKIYVEGSLRTEKWTDKEGNERYSTKIVGQVMKMLDSKKSQEQPASQQQHPFKAERAVFEDDIPF